MAGAAALLLTQAGCEKRATPTLSNEQRALVLEELGFLSNQPSSTGSAPHRAAEYSDPHPTLLAGDWIALGWATLDDSVFIYEPGMDTQSPFAGVVQTFYE